MSRPLDPTTGRIALAGDWHANTVVALAQIDRAHAAGAGIIVQLGDFGYGTPAINNRRYLMRIERKLQALDLHLVFLDGNHENFDRLEARRVDEQTGLRRISPHLHHLPRGFRWRFGEHVWMALGGAVSVDKRRRRQGLDWWPQEALRESDVQHAIAAGPVDVLLSHDAPPMPVAGLPTGFRIPPDVLAEANAHRALLGSVMAAVRPRHMWHGHLHVRHETRIAIGPGNESDNEPSDRTDCTDRQDGGRRGLGSDGTVHVHGLGADQGSWHANLALAGSDGARLAWPA